MHIGIYGRRNVGKSSLLNTLLRQQVSIVSAVAGTTADPVEKPMELLPLGPVLFIDTAGIDDTGALGELRVAKTWKIIERTDLGIIVTDGGCWGEFESALMDAFVKRGTPVVVVHNKADIATMPAEFRQRFTAAKTPLVETVAANGMGIGELREALVKAAPASFTEASALVSDLVGPGETAILVVPIDKEAPKGRLIMPQVQTIRDLLDGDSLCMVVKERELRSALGGLRNPPKLVVTDSQAFLKVAGDVPENVPLTSFSILMARAKGDLAAQVAGTLAIDSLRGGDKVLIAEACSHHPIGEDIGRVKIPRWLTQYVGAALDIHHVQGHDFPEDLARYKLVVHCGACMWNRREMLSRIARCHAAGVPITNYGLTIAYSLGIFARALGPFPAARDIFLRAQRERAQAKGTSTLIAPGGAT
jgi:[FeFe] hydrogenase H-cluster maturation GTPase HydF